MTMNDTTLQKSIACVAPKQSPVSQIQCELNQFLFGPLPASGQAEQQAETLDVFKLVH